MNEEPRHPDLPQEEDAIAWRKILLGALGSAVIILVLVIAAFSIVARGEARRRPSGEFPEERLGPRGSVAEVQQDLFGTARGFGQRLDEQKRRALSTYGWVDRERRIVRIPVDQAMELLLVESGR